jgi:hypothetical protein
LGAVKEQKAAKFEKELANNEFGSALTNFCIHNSMTKIMKTRLMAFLIVVVHLTKSKNYY